MRHRRKLGETMLLTNTTKFAFTNLEVYKRFLQENLSAVTAAVKVVAQVACVAAKSGTFTPPQASHAHLLLTLDKFPRQACPWFSSAVRSSGFSGKGGQGLLALSQPSKIQVSL